MIGGADSRTSAIGSKNVWKVLSVAEINCWYVSRTINHRVQRTPFLSGSCWMDNIVNILTIHEVLAEPAGPIHART